ncbi:MAG: hypothetical protein JSU86_05650 [Phycisphaerales bacterium]|nr:MAG: hypothetical protein JSU86_05650 [Phycisphaerales bacterium]
MRAENMMCNKEWTWALTLALGALAVALPQAAAQEEQPVFPNAVVVDVSLDRETFEVREPVIAGVTLLNRGPGALSVQVASDGAPVPVALECARGEADWTHHSLWLRNLPPQGRAIEVRAGEATRGEVFALGHYDSGYVFTSPGRYRMRWVCYLGKGRVKLYSEELSVTILPASRANSAFLSALDEGVAAEYYGGRRATPVELRRAEVREELERFGARLLGYIISQQMPHLVEPGRSPDDDREALLVERLTELLQQHPDSVYAGYVARFLGLVHVKTLEHEESLRVWAEWDPERTRAHPAYTKALHYLTMAKDADVWPRTAALENLVLLHTLAQEWDKGAEYLVALRERCADIGGVTVADKLEGQMQRFRRKVEARNTKESRSP